jgi:thymidine phosphorylase
MADTGRRMGKKVVALITDMEQPLGRCVGNSLEVQESVEVLQGKGPGDLRSLCLDLAAWMFQLGDRVKTVEEGKQLAKEMIACGSALKKFREIVGLQGGDPAAIDDPARLPQAKSKVDVPSPASGFVTNIRCEQVGTACVLLGGGRSRKEDSIDLAVGFILHKKVGDKVSAGESLCTIYYNSEAKLKEAQRLIEGSYRIAPAAPASTRPLIHHLIAAPLN